MRPIAVCWVAAVWMLSLIHISYTLHVAGLTRELTICKVNDHMDIAAFIMLGCLLYTSRCV